MTCQEISTSKESQSANAEELIRVYNELNEEGQQKLLCYTLTELLRYYLNLDKESKTIIKLLNGLNEEGRKKLVEYAKDLVLMDKYTLKEKESNCL